MAGIVREYKDRLFNFVFGNEENKAWTLSLYNAVNGSSYSDPEAIQINTIKEVIYLGMHNDVSFLLADEMSLYEQQSTFNPNMPLRLLQYAGNLYEKYIVDHQYNKYGSELIKLPVPKLIVFYNGTRDQEEETILRLSDSFPAGSKPDIEATVRMLNINYGKNKELLDACEPLKEYAWLMQKIREYRSTMSIEESVNLVFENIPDDFILKPFLEAHKAEVNGMLLTEYNEAETMKMFERDGERRGEVIGAIKTYRDEMGLLPSEIIRRIMFRFGLEKENAEEYVEQTLGVELV